MSWDVLLLSVSPDVRTINDLGDDFAGESLGTPTEVAHRLRQIFPALDLTDPSWGVLATEEYSVEFSIGDDNPCLSLMLHVRGPESAIEPIQRLCENTGWLAFDTSDGDLIDFSNDPAKGLRQWIEYRLKADPSGPLRGIALPIEGKGIVFFDAFAQRALEPPTKRWWQFWR